MKADPVSIVRREIEAANIESLSGVVLSDEAVNRRAEIIFQAAREYYSLRKPAVSKISDLEDRLRRVEDHLKLPPVEPH